MSDQQQTSGKSPSARFADATIREWHSEALSEVYDHDHERVERWWNEFVSCGFADLIALRDYLEAEVDKRRQTLSAYFAEQSENGPLPTVRTDPQVNELKEDTYTLLLRYLLLNDILRFRARGIANLKKWEGQVDARTRECARAALAALETLDDNKKTLETLWRTAAEQLPDEASGSTASYVREWIAQEELGYPAEGSNQDKFEAAESIIRRYGS